MPAVCLSVAVPCPAAAAARAARRAEGVETKRVPQTARSMSGLRENRP